MPNSVKIYMTLKLPSFWAGKLAGLLTLHVGLGNEMGRLFNA